MSADVMQNDLERLGGSMGRRRLLKAMAACGAMGPSLLAFGEALAAAPADTVVELNILVQGGPVGDALKTIANPMFNSMYPKATIELNASTNAAAFPKMLAHSGTTRSSAAVCSTICSQPGAR